MGQLKTLLDRCVAVDFIGREEEISFLLQTLESDGPVIAYLYGIAGLGKTSVLEAFTRHARAAGATVILLDCQAVEPTQAGLLSQLAAATGATSASPQDVAQRLGHVGRRVILALDTYEVFRLMDTWLRQVFIPLLPDNVRFVLSGREAPVSAWFSAPGWRGLFKALRLDSLDQHSSLEFLARAGVPLQEAKQLDSICHGHPLALTLAASLRSSEATASLRAAVGQRVVDELSRLYVADIADHQTRRALEAASVVRRVTVPLLACMLPDISPQDAHERIRALAFVQSDKDGLRIHDAVREAVASKLRADNPQEYREYRRAAHRHCISELRSAALPEFWRCTADLLYLLENPVIREAFFPTGAQEYVVEPAEPDDERHILEIIDRHEIPSMARSLAGWWKRAPDTFMVTRDHKGGAVGFYCAFDPSRFSTRVCREDPITRAWTEHLDNQPLPQKQRALFMRRWLAAETGESPSAVQAACWIDLKRKYLELRPDLRRVYLTVQDLAPYAAVALRLGFQPLTGNRSEAHIEGYFTALLDFGPSSVDGWLARLVAAELGVEPDGLLDCAARELVLKTGRVSLSKLEFGVMEYLQRRAGEAVPRVDLLQSVWEQNYAGGSNVVDVVIRALRKKLSDKASVIETVQGVGYRLHRE